MNLYPLKFRPLLQERLWGGRALENRLGKALPPGKKFGESWEVSDHPSAGGIVANGPLEGKRLADVLVSHPRELLGARLAQKFKRFPLLVKFLDANDWLSVQVHPGDDYALRNENDFGKTEAWVVLHADPGAKIIYGLKRSVGREEIRKSLKNDALRPLLNEVEVNSGDVVFVPAGTIHAIGAGIVIYEIQEASDVTYRLYDWGRVDDQGRPRSLHVEKSLTVADFKSSREPCVSPKGAVLVTCPYFGIEKHPLASPWERRMTEGFDVVTVTHGAGTLAWDGGQESLGLGETALVPAALRHYSLRPGHSVMTALLTYVPPPQP